MFACAAILLIWAILGLDWWSINRQYSGNLDGSSDDFMGVPTPSWGFLLFAIGLVATLLIIEGCRLLFGVRDQANQQFALQRQMIDHASEAMILTDAAQRILSVNAAFEQITGYNAAEVLGLTPTRLSAGHQGLNYHRIIWDFVAENGYWNGEVWDRRKDGSLYPKQMRITAIRDETGAASHFVATFADISEAKAQAERFDYLAHHDQLTNLPNRLALDAHLAGLLDGAVPGINRLALLIIDLDNFKTVNDSLGHHAGDRLLAELAQRMGAEMDRSTRLFRLGGDEFVVVINQLDRDDRIVGLLNRLVMVIGQPCDIDGHLLHNTSSIGVSLYPEHGRDGLTLIRNADAAMYAAKAAGRHNYKFFAESMNAAANKRLHLESELWRALAENQLVLHYQPQIDLLSGKVVGVEALVRWAHPVRGMIAPADFIPVAEECGLIQQLGHWVLLTACRQVRSWLDTGIDMGEMAVNISAHQFRQPDFVQTVRGILAETGLPANRLELEITESTVMHGVDAAIQTLAQLKAMGVRLAIDDFGTGYSSLSYLRRFPLDRLKIDRSFLADVDTDPEAASLVTSIVMLGRSLGLQLVAEGVESFAQAEFLRTLECERVQGFHFFEPVSADEVIGFGRCADYVPLPA
ncbi:MAG: EAL domain-containing protein [Dechloromonas sp.]|nr:EAL domain-containing protein [Dechloromonas sp.]